MSLLVEMKKKGEWRGEANNRMTKYVWKVEQWIFKTKNKYILVCNGIIKLINEFVSKIRKER